MKSKCKSLFILFLFVFGWFFSVPVRGEETSKTVLFISSYSYSDTRVIKEMNGLQNSLDSSVQIDYVFMNSDYVNTDTSFSTTYAQVHSMMTSRTYDVILLGGDPALSFAKTYYNDLFSKTPVVFENITSTALANEARNYGFTGVHSSFNIGNTLLASQRIQPNSTSVVAICGETENDATALSQFRSLPSVVQDKTTSILNPTQMTQQEIISQISSYGEDTVLFYFSMPIDADGNTYTADTAAALLSQYAQIPIYSTTDQGIGNGFFGGNVANSTTQGRQAGTMINEILSGASPSSIAVMEIEPSYSYDYNVMKKFSIDVSSVPNDSDILNYEENFLEKNRSVLIPVAAIGAVLLVVIILLSVTSRHNASMYHRYRRKENESNRLLNQVPGGIGVFTLNKDGTKVSVNYLNDSLFQMMNVNRKSKEEIFSENPFGCVYKEDIPGIMRALKRCVETGTDQNEIIRLYVGDGKQTNWFSVNARLIRKHRNDMQIYTSFHNVNDEQNAKAQIESNRIFLSTAIRNTRMIILNYNPDRHTMLYDSNNSVFLPDIKELVIDNYPASLENMLLHPKEDLPLLLETLQKVDAGEEGQSCVIRTRFHDGYHWMKYDFTSIYNAEHKRVYVLVTGINADTQKKAELMYTEQLRYINDVNDENLIGKARFNLSKNIIEYFAATDSRAAFLDDSTTYDGLIASIASKITDAYTAREFLKKMSRNSVINDFSHGNVTQHQEYPCKADHGSPSYWTNTTIRCFANPDTDDIILFLYSYDISKQVTERNIIRHLTNIDYDYLLLIDVNTRQCILSEERAGQITTIGEYSDYAKRMEENIRSQIIPSQVPTILEKSSLETIRSELEKNDEIYSFIGTKKEKDNQVSYKRYQYSYLDGGHATILMTRTDVTSLIQEQQAQLQRTQEALEEAKVASQAKSDFLSRMSHDIRTPMNGIIGISEIELENEQDTTSHQDWFKVYSSAKFLLGLVNDILDLSKIESGYVQLNPQPYPKSEFLSYLDGVIQPLVDQKHQHLKIGPLLEDNIIPVIDKLRFNQIIFNLLSNAVKYSPEGGEIAFYADSVIQDSTSHTVSCVYHIVDHGIGISPEFMKNLFTPFIQENDETVREAGGSGLGLAIVKNLTTMMNGTIDVESEKGKGSTFSVSLTTPYQDSTQAVFTTQDYSILKGKHILLCEDHPLNREIATRILIKEGMRVDSAEDGKIGLEKFVASPIHDYDAIIMDIRMPVMDGLESAKAIRALNRPDAKSVVILAMSANAFTKDIEMSLQAGMNAHLSKPIDPKVLYQTLVENIKK